MATFDPKRPINTKDHRWVQVQVTARFYAELAEAAKKRKLSLSEFMRQALDFAVESLPENNERKP